MWVVKPRPAHAWKVRSHPFRKKEKQKKRERRGKGPVSPRRQCAPSPEFSIPRLEGPRTPSVVPVTSPHTAPCCRSPPVPAPVPACRRCFQSVVPRNHLCGRRPSPHIAPLPRGILLYILIDDDERVYPSPVSSSPFPPILSGTRIPDPSPSSPDPIASGFHALRLHGLSSVLSLVFPANTPRLNPRTTLWWCSPVSPPPSRVFRRPARPSSAPVAPLARQVTLPQVPALVCALSPKPSR